MDVGFPFRKLPTVVNDRHSIPDESDEPLFGVLDWVELGLDGRGRFIEVVLCVLDVEAGGDGKVICEGGMLYRD